MMVEPSKRRTALVLIFLLKFFSKPLIIVGHFGRPSQSVLGAIFVISER